jgi:hypothetical protein
MAGIVEQLVSLPNGVTVEARLDDLQSEAETKYPRGKMALMAVRYYLRWVLAEATYSTVHTTASVTNYAFLVRRLDRWRIVDKAEPESIVVVNFNYDTIFDQTLWRQLRGLGRPDIDAYATWIPEWTNLKVHGSWEWAEVVTGIAPGVNANAYDLIRAAEQIKPTSEYLWWDSSPQNTNSVIPLEQGAPPVVVMPALALPLRGKTTFSCPDEHLKELREKLPQVTRILTIGWRGEDQHFLDLLRKANIARCQVLTVTKTERGQAAVVEALRGAGVDGNFDYHFDENAFSTFMRSNKLEQFLARD